jgi:hypothetical protein
MHPVTGATSSVCDCQYLKLARLKLPKDHNVRKSSHQVTTRVSEVFRPPVWIDSDAFNCGVEFSYKLRCCRCTPIRIPFVCSARLGNRLGMKANAILGHPSRPESSAVPQTRESPTLSRYLTQRCGLRSRRPTAPLHPGQSESRGCQEVGPPSRPGRFPAELELPLVVVGRFGSYYWIIPRFLAPPSVAFEIGSGIVTIRVAAVRT